MNRSLLVLLLLSAFAANGFGQSDNVKGEAYYHFSKGRMLDDQGRSSQAIDEYKKALELDPNNSQIYSEMAESYLKNNRVREAVDTANQAIKADPNNIEAQLDKGVLTVKAHKRPETKPRKILVGGASQKALDSGEPK